MGEVLVGHLGFINVTHILYIKERTKTYGPSKFWRFFLTSSIKCKPKNGDGLSAT